jgi:hypothetical protein
LHGQTNAPTHGTPPWQSELVQQRPGTTDLQTPFTHGWWMKSPQSVLD